MKTDTNKHTDGLTEYEVLRIKVNAILNPEDDESKFVDTEDVDATIRLIMEEVRAAQPGFMKSGATIPYQTFGKKKYVELDWLQSQLTREHGGSDE